ncbi:hypothetical protein [Streptomyces mexicanus]|uniref:Uncharacterized protein n=1 Tax=Streptomyces mexicanus TaxID=178566 RepID=A0A7X1LRY9_9ACTN|nr:hypothetical protein [Streptomyces mexicanus]MBC2867625.1 hypothetical protein [Streptomyces mexicanus]
MTTIILQLAAGTPQVLLAVVVLAVTFLLALAIATRGTGPAERAAVLRALAQLIPLRRR